MAKMNNIYIEKGVSEALLKVLSKSVEDFEKKHHGNGLFSPFKLSQYWLDKKKWASMGALIKGINALNAQRERENKLLLYVQPNSSDKPEAVLVRLTDDKTLFTKKEPKESDNKAPTKETLLKSLEKAIKSVAETSAGEGWQEDFQSLLKKYCH